MPQSPLNFSSKSPSGALAPTILGVQGDLLTSGFHGQKYHQAYVGGLFVGANPTAVTTSAGLSATCVGLILSNPAGNTMNLVLRRLGAALVVVTTGETVFNLITGFAAGGITAHTTALTPFSSKIGSGITPTAKLDSAATLVGTPIYTMILGETPTATAFSQFSIDLDGSIVLIPGAYAAIGTSIASPASGFLGSMEWEEVPV